MHELLVKFDVGVLVEHFCCDEVTYPARKEHVEFGEGLHSRKQAEDVDCCAQDFVVELQVVVDLPKELGALNQPALLNLLGHASKDNIR